MSETRTFAYSDLCPGVPSRAAWNQALVEQSARSSHIVIACDAATRVDAGFIAALGPAEQERVRHGGSLRIEATTDDQRTLLRLSGHDRLLIAVAGSMAQDLSCQVTCHEQEIVVRVQASALQNERLALPATYSWIRCLNVEALVIDLEHLPHINSVLVAWVLQLAQAAKPATVRLKNVNRQVNIQLTQLRLHHLLSLDPL